MSSSGLSIREYARHRRAAGLKGGTPSAVHKAIVSGRIKRDENGLIDQSVADGAWDAATGEARALPQRIAQQPAVDGSNRQPAAPSYAASRAIREAYAARMAKIAYEEKIGSVVSAESVKDAAFNCARETRRAILDVPCRLSELLAAETNPAAIESLLTKELIAALDSLSNG